MDEYMYLPLRYGSIVNRNVNNNNYGQNSRL